MSIWPFWLIREKAGSNSHRYSHSGEISKHKQRERDRSKRQTSKQNKLKLLNGVFILINTCLLVLYTKNIFALLLCCQAMAPLRCSHRCSVEYVHSIGCSVSQVPSWESLQSENRVREIKVWCIVLCSFFLLLLKSVIMRYSFCIPYHLVRKIFFCLFFYPSSIVKSLRGDTTSFNFCSPYPWHLASE